MYNHLLPNGQRAIIMKQASAGGPESGLSETNKHRQTLLLLLDHIVINTCIYAIFTLNMCNDYRYTVP